MKTSNVYEFYEFKHKQNYDVRIQGSGIHEKWLEQGFYSVGNVLGVFSFVLSTG